MSKVTYPRELSAVEINNLLMKLDEADLSLLEMDRLMASLRTVSSRAEDMLSLQQTMQQHQRMFQVMGNILRAQQDALKSITQNIRS